jgi:BA14K-like protein
MRAFHFALTMFFELLVVELTIGLSATDGIAQTQDRRQMQTAPRVTPRTGGSSVPRSSRIVTPPAGSLVRPPSSRVIIPRGPSTLPGMHAPVTRRNHNIIMPRGTMTRRSQRTITSRAITKLPDKSSAPVARFKRQAIRKAPVNVALVNSGRRRNPGRNKPANIEHNPKHKADKAGWMHRHRPFFFKHAGHRWRRHYYSFLIGGLWYWYWYDVEADDDPALVTYSDPALPDCDPEIDECTEPEVIAPAILEGRATQEAMADCAADFRSFDARTGTYVTRQGEVRVCPYLE